MMRVFTLVSSCLKYFCTYRMKFAVQSPSVCGSVEESGQFQLPVLRGSVKEYILPLSHHQSRHYAERQLINRHQTSPCSPSAVRMGGVPNSGSNKNELLSFWAQTSSSREPPSSQCKETGGRQDPLFFCLVFMFSDDGWAALRNQRATLARSDFYNSDVGGWSWAFSAKVSSAHSGRRNH